MSHLANVLPLCCRLERLKLQGNTIGNAGAAALAGALSKTAALFGLKILLLDNNAIGDGGASALFQIPGPVRTALPRGAVPLIVLFIVVCRPRCLTLLNASYSFLPTITYVTTVTGAQDGESDEQRDHGGVGGAARQGAHPGGVPQGGGQDLPRGARARALGSA